MVAMVLLFMLAPPFGGVGAGGIGADAPRRVHRVRVAASFRKGCANPRASGVPPSEQWAAPTASPSSRRAVGRRTDRHLASCRDCWTRGSPAATFCSEAEPQARRVIASRAGAMPLELMSRGGRSREDAQEATGQLARSYHQNAVRESRGATSLTRASQRRNFLDSFYTYR